MSRFSRLLTVSLLLACSFLAGCGSGSGLQGTWKLSRDAMLDLPLMQADTDLGPLVGPVSMSK